MTESEFVKCWFCSEQIPLEEKKCRNCGEWIINKNKVINKTKDKIGLKEFFIKKLKKEIKDLRESFKALDKNSQVGIGCFSIIVLCFFIPLVIIIFFDKPIDTSNDRPASLSSGEYILKNDYFGAYSESDLDLISRILINNDKNALYQLLNTGRVFLVKSGTKVYLVESGGLLSGKIKVREEGKISNYWVVSEALK